MKKMTTAGCVALAALAAFGMASTNASMAHADEQPELVTVLWILPVGSSWPQMLVNHVDRDDLGAFGPSTAGLLCGRDYQADVYTAADYKIVVEDGTLTEGEDYGKALKWNLFSTPACATETPMPTPTETAPATPPVVVTPPATSSPTPVPTSTPTSTGTPAPTKSPVSSPAPSAPSPSTAPATAPATAAVTPPSSATAQTATDAGLLAYTGSQHVVVMSLIAALLLGLGAAFTRVAILRRRSLK